MNKIEEINEIIKVPLNDRTEENQNRLAYLLTKDMEELKSSGDIVAEIMLKVYGLREGDDYINYKEDFIELKKLPEETIVDFAHRVGETLTIEKAKFNKNIDILDKFIYTQTFIKKYINLYYKKKFKLKRVDVEATINKILSA